MTLEKQYFREILNSARFVWLLILRSRGERQTDRKAYIQTYIHTAIHRDIHFYNSCLGSFWGP